MKALNSVNKNVLAEKLDCADTFLTRMRGLLGKKSMAVGSGLWIKPCRGVHTLGMKFPIDVVFLDRDNKVLDVKKDLQPNRLTRIIINAHSVLELPAGTIDAASINIGDQIRIV